MRHRDDDSEPAPGRRRRVTIGAAVVLVIAAFVIAVVVSATSGGARVDVAGSVSTATPTPVPSAPAPLFVHVSGAVREPGLVTLDAGSRVVDAVTAAGGLADDADPDGVNLARLVQDGEQLRVPRAGEAVEAAPADTVQAADAIVDLNTATQDQLEDLPRIGPALAQRILEWRAANGRFGAVDDLLQVTGIGQKIFDGLKDRVRV